MPSARWWSTARFKVKLSEKGLNLKSYYGETRDTEADIEAKLTKEIDNSLDRAVEIVRNRIDQYGVAEPQIQKIGNSRIIVELPGVSNPQEVRKLLEGTGLLEFKLIYDPQKVVKVLEAINKDKGSSKKNTFFIFFEFII